MSASAVALAAAMTFVAAAAPAPNDNSKTMESYYKVLVGTQIIESKMALAIGVAVAAVVVAQIVLRVRWAVVEAGKDRQVAALSVLQHDEQLESQAEASAQVFPLGACISTKTHGIATVRAFNASAKTYDVEIDGSEALVTLSEDDIDIAEVSALYVYPIKSCAGMRLESTEITATGIVHDRNWMFTDENGKFITQRRYHKMALIAPKLLPSMENPTSIVLTAPDMDDLEVPILRDGKGDECTVTVWRSTMRALDQGEAAAAWINTFLADVRGDRKFRFVRVKDSFTRAVNPKYAPGHATGFADGYPFLLALESSLTELNKSLEHAIPINRFRPNIVLKGAPPFAEEHWNCMVIDGLRFRNVKPCDRCNLPCVDQATGVSDPNREPSKTLARLRNGEVLGFTNGSKHDNYFGSNVVAERIGAVHVGARVQVLTLKREVFA